MKRVLLVLGILFALLIVAALVLPFVIDANQFRPRLEAELTKALGREVKLGNLKLAILQGAVAADDLSIADDPAFSISPFIAAKSLNVGVELKPLIFDRQLNVTAITIDSPAISLIQSGAGTWNYASLGTKNPAGSQPSSSSPGVASSFSVKLLKITNGRVSLKLAGEPTPNVLNKLAVEVTDFAVAASFPFSLAADIEGGGDIKLNGKAGPMNTTDASATPWDAALKINKLDMLKTGFVRAATGFAGLISVDGTASFNGGDLRLAGAVQADQLKLAKGGRPSNRPVGFDFQLDHDVKRRAGVLHSGDVRIGSAKAKINGSYRTEANGTFVNMKLNGPAMAVSELEAILPALDIVLPQGSSLKGGELAAAITVEGLTDRLVSQGRIALTKTRLVGFDLGSRINTIAKLTGIQISPDTDFDNLSADVHAAPDGTKVQNISVIAPAIGELSGAGTVSPANALNFKMRAQVKTGGLMTAISSSGQTAVPFSIQGTASEPKFVADVKGLVGGMAVGIATDQLKAVNPDLGAAAEGIIGLFGRKKQN